MRKRKDTEVGLFEVERGAGEGRPEAIDRRPHKYAIEAIVRTVLVKQGVRETGSRPGLEVQITLPPQPQPSVRGVGRGKPPSGPDFFPPRPALSQRQFRGEEEPLGYQSLTDAGEGGDVGPTVW